VRDPSPKTKRGTLCSARLIMIGKTVPVSAVCEIAARISGMLFSRGLLARTFLPDQRIEPAQGKVEGVEPVAHADGVLGAAVVGELLLEGLDLGPEDVALGVEHARHRGAQLVAQGRERHRVLEQRDGHRPQRASSSRSARVISRISSSKLVSGTQPRSRPALPGSPIRWSTSAGRTNDGSIVT